MSRMTDNDRTWGPFTWGPWHKCLSVEWSSGGGEDQDSRNYILFAAFGRALRIWLPRILRPWVNVRPSCIDPKRMFTDVWPREYGFTLTSSGGVGESCYDFLIVSLGAQTHDSTTTKKWSKFLPWKQWEHVRHSLYAPDGSHLYTEPRFKRGHRPQGFDHCIWHKRETAPASYFEFEDYDGKRIIATCHIEEREWHKGTGWFRWLKWFSKPKIHRSLNLEFDHEVGPEKGSWKGGTVGTSAEMRKEDHPINAFRRWCDKEHRARGSRHYKLTFIGPCGPPEPREIRVARNRGWVQDASGLWRLTGSLGVGISTEEMLARIKADQDVNNAQIAGQLKG